MPLSIPKRISLVSQVVETVRAGLADGTWTDWLPGERVLCDRLNVSRPTLRLALRELEKEGCVRLDTDRRRRIDLAAQPPQAPHKVVVLLTPIPLYMAPPLTLFWMAEMREHFTAAGYQFEIRAGEQYYRENPEKAIGDLVRHGRIAGWVLWRSNARMQAWFAGRKLPCLVAGSCCAGGDLPSLDLDHRSVCRHAAGQLLARGHGRMALIVNDRGLIEDQDSIEGVQEAWSKSAPAAPPPVIVRHDGSAESIVKRLDGLLGGPSPPTGFLVAGSATVLTVVGHLLRRGLRLPQDAALISRDSDPFLEWVVPTVARYVLSPKAYERVATRLLLQLVQGQPLAQREVRLTPEFIKGDTFANGTRSEVAVARRGLRALPGGLSQFNRGVEYAG